MALNQRPSGSPEKLRPQGYLRLSCPQSNERKEDTVAPEKCSNWLGGWSRPHLIDVSALRLILNLGTLVF